MESFYSTLKVSSLFILLMVGFIAIAGILLWWAAGHENSDK
jgi:hypothetical protein